MTTTAVQTWRDTIRKLELWAAGKDLRSVYEDQIREIVGGLTIDEGITLWRTTRADEQRDRAEQEEARAADLAVIHKAVQDARDEGSPNEPPIFPLVGEHMEACAERQRARESRYRCSRPARLRAIAAALDVAYRRDGEPRELQELRRDIAAAKRATWPLFDALQKSRERYNYLRLDHEAEREVMAASAAVDAAERVHDALRRRLVDDFAVFTS
jgi:hypothetical protein